MSAYNMLAMAKGPRGTEALRGLVPGLPSLVNMDLVLGEMCRRGWITFGPNGWDVVDAKRRLVRMRDLSDASDVRGELRGGWNGWLVRCAQRGMLTIEDAIAEGRAA
jgi:hypothetical protein